MEYSARKWMLLNGVVVLIVTVPLSAIVINRQSSQLKKKLQILQLVFKFGLTCFSDRITCHDMLHLN
jgi:hypothetical protein